MKRILIVEDDQWIKQLFSNLLFSAGFSVDTASNGQIALSLIKAQYYDLIYTGMKMPEMDGISLLERIKNENLPHGPILVFSNITDSETQEKALALGAERYSILSKTSPEEALRIMTGYLNT